MIKPQLPIFVLRFRSKMLN